MKIEMDADLQRAMWDQWAPYFDEWNSVKHSEISMSADSAVEFLSSLAPAGRFLELGIGTGRVALKIAGRGPSVHGIDISPAMIGQLENKRGELPVTGEVGNISSFSFPSSFDVIYTVQSTIFSLTDQEAQISCIHDSAKSLSPDGFLVIEAFVPQAEMFNPARSLKLRRFRENSLDFSAMIVDAAEQRIEYREVSMSEGKTKVLPVEQRYIWPAELDLMARIAGLRLAYRFSSFARGPFTRNSITHVSVYQTADTP